MRTGPNGGENEGGVSPIWPPMSEFGVPNPVSVSLRICDPAKEQASQ